MTHIGATSRIHGVDNLHGVGRGVRHGSGRCRGKGVPQRGEFFRNRLTDVVHRFSVVNVTRFHRDEGLDFLFKPQHVARKLHAAYRIATAFRHVDRNEDVRLIGCNRHLHAVDLKVEVPLIEVETADRFQVRRKLFAGIQIALRVPARPTVFGELHLLGKVVRVKEFVTHEADLLNGRRAAFVDVHRDAHAVAFQGRRIRRHLDAVKPSRQVLPAHFLIGAIQNRLIENTAFGQSHVPETLFDARLIKGLDAVRFNTRHGRTFREVQNQHVAVNAHAHVTEKPGRIKHVNGFGTGFRRVLIPYPKRQMGKDRTGFRTLNAFHPDVPDREDLSRRRGGKRREHRGRRRAHQKGLSHKCRLSSLIIGSLPMKRMKNRHFHFIGKKFVLV